jgi:hypothetical protein
MQRQKLRDALEEADTQGVQHSGRQDRLKKRDRPASLFHTDVTSS